MTLSAEINKRRQRTEEFENAAKTLIFESQIAEEIQEMTENLQQKNFDNLISRGIIVEDSEFIEVNAAE